MENKGHNSSEENKKSEESKYEKVKTITEIAQNIAVVLTFFGTILAFCFQSYIYFYEWGYYSAMELDMGDQIKNSHYSIVLIAMGVLCIVANSSVYVLTSTIKSDTRENKLKDIITIAILASFELLSYCYWAWNFGINIGNHIIILVLLLALFNGIGIVFRILTPLSPKSKIWSLLGCDNDAVIAKVKEYFIWARLAVIFIFGGCAITYEFGGNQANAKTVYKIIISEDTENMDKKYIFTEDNEKEVIKCPVLYEDTNSYIVSYLYNKGDGIEVDKKHQKVISKEGVQAVYENIDFKSVQDETSNQQEGVTVEKSEEDNGENMDYCLVIAIVFGVILGGFVVNFCKNRGRKKSALKRQTASIIYFDLKSIEWYLRMENMSERIRYSNVWQDMKRYCTFLTKANKNYISRIYEQVYEYNASFGKGNNCNELKEKLYSKLKKMIFDCNTDELNNANYDDLLDTLREVKDKS